MGSRNNKLGSEEKFIVKKYSTKSRKVTFAENLIGWIGITMTLSAYFMISLGFLIAGNINYILLNLIGASGVAYTAYRYGNYQSTFVNIIWIAVAVLGIANKIIGAGG